MKKTYEKIFCDCCGKKMESEEGITNFRSTFKAYWYDSYGVVTEHDDLKRSEDHWAHRYRNIIPEHNDEYNNVSNHEIAQESRTDVEFIKMEMENICKDCATELITHLKKFRDDYMSTGVLKNELENDSLNNFTTEQLLDEIKRRTE